MSNNVNKCHTLPDGFFSNIGKTDSCLKRLTGRILASLWLFKSLYFVQKIILKLYYININN